MRCKTCGGTLKLKNGIYVCENCQDKFEIASFYENTEAVICYIENDEFDRRSKDSIIAQEVYNKLSAANINIFFQRVSASDLTSEELKKAYDAAKNSAKAIILLGGSNESFATLVSENKDLFSDKIILPVYFDINAYDLPKELSAYQSLNYNNVGSIIDLSKKILSILGRDKEVNVFEVKDKKAAMKKKVILIISLTIISVTLISGLYFVFGTTYVLPGKKYDKAEGLISNQQYADAIEIFCEINDYKNSAELLKNAYGQYVGYYKNADGNIGLHISISDGLRADIEVTETLADRTIVKITESAEMVRNLINFSFNDSQNNQGSMQLELKNDGINMTKIPDNSQEQPIETFFPLVGKSDKPILKKLDANTLLEWLNTKISMNQIKAMGYEIEEYGLMERDGLNRYYKIKNTDIVLAMFGIDISDGGTRSESAELSDKILFGLQAPAEIIIPDSIGKDYVPFTNNGVVYWPGGIGGECGSPVQFEIINYSEQTETKISAETPIAVTVKNILTEDNWERITNDILEFIVEKEARSYYKVATDDFCNANFEARNDTHALFSIHTKELNDKLLYGLFKINKSNKKVEFVMEVAKINDPRGGVSQLDWRVLYPELANDFPLLEYEY